MERAREKDRFLYQLDRGEIRHQSGISQSVEWNDEHAACMSLIELLINGGGRK